MNRSLWLLTGLAGLGGILWLAFFAAGPERGILATKLSSTTPAPASQPDKKAAPSRPFSEPKQPLPADKQEKAIAQGELITKLFEAGSEGGAAQVESVYSALAHPDPEVRTAAVDVIVQYIGKDGIPRLRAAQAAAALPAEKTQIEEAIKFLELPSFQEVMGSEATLQLLKKSGPRPKKPSNELRDSGSRR